MEVVGETYSRTVVKFWGTGEKTQKLVGCTKFQIVMRATALFSIIFEQKQAMNVIFLKPSTGEEPFNLESLLEKDTKAFCLKGLNYLLANELRTILFLTLRKFIFENRRVLNT